MMQYIETDATETYATGYGLVTVAQDIPAGAIVVPAGIDGQALLRMYRPDALRLTPDIPLSERTDLDDWAALADWALRPTCPIPDALAGAPYTAVIRDCPQGCRAEVIDRIGEEVIGEAQEADGTIVISLPDPGLYRIEVNAPLPWLTSTVHVSSGAAS
jgi:hypothetical protein